MSLAGAARIVAIAMLAGSATTAAGADGPDGRAIYNFRCYYCHGYSGDAKTLAATMLPTKPRDFRASTPESLGRERIATAVRNGVPGTAMKAFANVLSPVEIAAVAAFVEDEFVVRRATNTRYHTPENGWPDHQRYAPAFAFAEGRLAIDTPPEKLTEGEREGRRLFLSTCVTCHDRGRVNDPGPAWEKVPARGR